MSRHIPKKNAFTFIMAVYFVQLYDIIIEIIFSKLELGFLKKESLLINHNLKILFSVIIGVLVLWEIYYFLNSNRIPPNTHFIDINISGKSIAEAESLVDDRIELFEEEGVNIEVEDRNIEASLSSLGISIDKKATAEQISDLKIEPFHLIFQKKVPLVYSFNASKFSANLDKLISTYEELPTDATIVFEEKNFVISKEKPGYLIDRNKFAIDLRNNLENLSEKPILASKYLAQPEVFEVQAEKALEKVTLLNKQKIVLAFESDLWNLTGSELIDILKFNPLGKEKGYILDFEIGKTPILLVDFHYPDSAEKLLEVSLDPLKLDNLIQKIAKLIDRPTVDATLKFEGGKIVEFIPARDGRKLDIQLAKELILQKVSISNITLEKDITIKLPVTITIAEIANEEINSLGINELVGRGVSYFAGSIANRIHNLSLGSQRISGTVVKPGETFSFNQAVGEVSAATGYKPAYVISKGRTVLDDGGGMCQVSTTVFRAALNAGLPIVSRTAHAYRVGYYEQKGFKAGLDATVWSPSVDLKFKNDTLKHILVQAVVDRTNLKLEIDIYGTTDGRRVEITDPVISNQKPPPEDKYEDDPTLPKGTVKQVDFAAWGANSVFNRKVYKANELIIDESFKSVYRPWQAVYLVGTGG